jgi:hypothetical protein
MLITQLWLKMLWRRAWERDLVPVNMMEKADIGVDHRVRDCVYSDDEIKASWQAADKLGPVEGSYIKLLILLAPRKTALAAMPARCRQPDALDDAARAGQGEENGQQEARLPHAAAAAGPAHHQKLAER